ncbi:site-specific DNA-methyltransferase [Falsihalocynthiibacter sp. BN13B15]|uniref:site-specific DNA-methyltransferase n=1 Tax=Falsihalocynthiibacter sp. BN13B15 TaxID=3240871 RepID=UPI00350F858B
MSKNHKAIFKSRRACSADKANGSNWQSTDEVVTCPEFLIRNDLAPELNSILVTVANLKPSQHQVRKPTKKQISKVKRSIEVFGFVAPILINGENDIVDGHSRVEAARALGLKSIPCLQVGHLSEPEVRALRIALNRTQETGAWDEDVLKLEFEYLLDFRADLEITGFEPPEIDMILEVGGPTGDEVDSVDDISDLPNTKTAAVTQTGDLWILGDHRILCGNARSLVDIDRLVQASPVAMVFTDPPFNVPINGHVRVSAGKFEEFSEASGEMTPDAFIAFLAETLGNAMSTLKLGGLLYAFMDWRHMSEMQAALDQIGLKLINLCVWAKVNGGMGSFYRSRHELVFVAKLPGAPHRNNIELGKHGRYRTNVWEYAGATGGARSQEDDFTLHPTVKPVKLVMDAILDATAIDEVILDPFLGSGSTLLAAERARRRCFGVEISPAYVDVAIRRWQAMTGLDAVHMETGERFNDRKGRLSDGDDADGYPEELLEIASVEPADGIPDWESF